MVVVLTEQQFEMLMKHPVNEDVFTEGDKVKLVKEFLDGNFVKASMDELGDGGLPKSKGIVVAVNKYKQPIKTLDDVDLFHVVQEKFKPLFGDDNDKRDEFLKRVIKAWYNGKISQFNDIMN